jgi:hypothetical protein
MLKCPMCRDMLPDDMRKCRKCQTDLSLLSDYVSHLRAGLSQADGLTKAGELGEAVWAYLAVLEVDPDNTTARRQVGKVVTAVRQFDQTAPGRRWLRALHKENRWTRWLLSREEGEGSPLLGWALLFVLFFGSVVGAYYLGYDTGKRSVEVIAPDESEKDKPKEKVKPPELKKGRDERPAGGK